MFSSIKTIFAFLAGIIFSFHLLGDDAGARAFFEEAVLLEKSDDFTGAGRKYMDADFVADDTVLKINSLKKAAECFRKGKSLYLEFKAVEKQLRNYPMESDFNSLVEREYQIGNMFYAGRRDPALSWMPWIKDDDRTIEAYEAVKKNAPFAKFAPELKFRLGIMYIEENKIDEAVEVFEEINEFHKDSPEEKFALFELAGIYLQKSSRGDGDGKWRRKARQALRKIIEKYPDDKEVEWARSGLKKADTLNAERILGFARFYHSRNDDDAAARYLNDLITEYPKTEPAEQAAKLLAEMNRTYKESPLKSEQPEYANITYDPVDMPPEKEKYIEVPEGSNGKWMLPLEDLELEKHRKDTDEKKMPEE
jgi:outer membrane assembly lipoprotein YfiO